MSMPLKVLVFYRGTLDSIRGTPIRAGAIMARLARDPELELTVASWDTVLPSAIAPKNFIHLPNKHLRELFELIRCVRVNHIQVIVGHTISSAYYLIALRLFTKCKIVLEMHGFAEEEAKEYGEINFFHYWWQKLIYNIGYSSCHLITTCSPSASKFLEKSGRTVVTVYGGVDTAVFRPQTENNPNHSEIIIGYAGNSRRWQGLDFLIAAYTALKREHPEFTLKLLLSERKGLVGVPTNGLDIQGPVPPHEVPAFLAQCDILVIPRPSTWVTRISFPSKLPEYLAMGKPVIASNVGDADTVIVNGKNGFIYTPGNQAEFIACLLALKNANARKEIGDAALATSSFFAWDKQVPLLAAELKKLA